MNELEFMKPCAHLRQEEQRLLTAGGEHVEIGCLDCGRLLDKWTEYYDDED